MAFKEQTTQARGSNGKGVAPSLLDNEEYQDRINNLLDALPTQDRKIRALHNEGWSPVQMQIVLRTANGKVTPVQHINQVLQKVRAGK
jgi:hypothetical protein